MLNILYFSNKYLRIVIHQFVNAICASSLNTEYNGNNLGSKTPFCQSTGTVSIITTNQVSIEAIIVHHAAWPIK